MSSKLLCSVLTLRLDNNAALILALLFGLILGSLVWSTRIENRTRNMEDKWMSFDQIVNDISWLKHVPQSLHSRSIFFNGLNPLLIFTLSVTHSWIQLLWTQPILKFRGYNCKHLCTASPKKQLSWPTRSVQNTPMSQQLLNIESHACTNRPAIPKIPFIMRKFYIASRSVINKTSPVVGSIPLRDWKVRNENQQCFQPCHYDLKVE